MKDIFCEFSSNEFELLSIISQRKYAEIASKKCAAKRYL